MDTQKPVTTDSAQSCTEPPNETPAERYLDVIVVIPALNEELVIGSIVLKALRIVEKVIVVDDGSTDRTAEVAACGGAIVIRNPCNKGKAHALCTGLLHARDLGCTVAVTLDGDGQHRTREIPRLIKPIRDGKADLVIGSRFLGETEGVPFYRRIGQKTLDMFTEIGSGYQCSDTQSGFRAFSRRALDNLNFTSTGYNIESDMIHHFAKRGLIIMEVPTTVRNKVPHMHKKNAFTHGLGVLGGIIHLISYRRPMLAFGIPGALMIAAGSIVEFWVLEELVVREVFHYMLALGSAFILILGMMLVIAGLILNALVIIIHAEKEG